MLNMDRSEKCLYLKRVTLFALGNVFRVLPRSLLASGEHHKRVELTHRQYELSLPLSTRTLA